MPYQTARALNIGLNVLPNYVAFRFSEDMNSKIKDD